MIHWFVSNEWVENEEILILNNYFLFIYLHIYIFLNKDKIQIVTFANYWYFKIIRYD